MDPVRFDRLARRFAAGMGIGLTRRQAAGAALAGVAALAARKPAAAQESPYGGVALGGQCGSHVECVQTSYDGQVASVTCASNGFDWDGPLNCCLYDGGGCGDDSHCCAGLTCGAITTTQGYTRYVCQSAGGGTYVNRQCWSDAECQAYDPNTTCDGVSYRYPGTCYGLQGAGCATAEACYDLLQCVGGACSAVSAGTYRTAMADLNMRSGSDATTYILTLVPAGATVVVLSDYTENGYVRVRYGGYEGYVLANLLG